MAMPYYHHGHALLNLPQAVSLRHVDLSFNRFGGKIAKCISSMLAANKGITSLNLAGNEMHDEVLYYILYVNMVYLQQYIQ
jgi:hypothetical protein